MICRQLIESFNSCIKDLIFQFSNLHLLLNLHLCFILLESLSLGVGATLLLDNTIEHVLSFDFKFLTSGSITVYVDTNTKKQYSIHYITQE